MARILLCSICSGLVLVASAGNGFGGANQPSAEQVRFFETSIRPVLAEHCYKCHGPTKQKADLRLDSRDAILKGSLSGPVVSAGQPGKSLLIKAVRHEDEALEMPPGKKLSDRQIADLARWIKMGLPFPQTPVVQRGEKDRDFWDFKPPAAPPSPAVRDKSWPRSRLDHFVLARLEERGLTPARPADRRSLIRRATFDLIGLPPTPDEVDAFVNDLSPQAFAKVVDRLLASPHYGERWGRHWLDVVRYADSNGLDENVAFGNAWRYRDYVVAAFNQDMPYDQFLLEQIAGDLLPAPGPEVKDRLLIATGFLALGPKVLAEVDERKMEMDIIDEQVDTFGRVALGLTLGCARCHDHKFDPFTMEDYYGLAGIFKSTRTMETFTKIARWHENPLQSGGQPAKKAEYDRLLKTKKDAINDLTRKADEQVKAAAKAGTTLPKNLEALYPEKVKIELRQLRQDLAILQKSAPEVPSAMGVTEGTVVDVPIHVRGSHLKLGKVALRNVPRVLAGPEPPTISKQQSGRLELARWLIRPDHPLTARVMVNRIWRWHFGRGIVASTDNLGRLGDAPGNQAILDWLARRFIDGNWSIKDLHRRIMLSSTYQMSTADDPKTSAIDPENRLSWRSSVRRLEAEAIRDALLTVSGALDRSMGGKAIHHVKNREFLFDHTSRDGTTYDSRRRSLYLPVVRNNVYDVFGLFDFPDPAVPSGDRATTTVAPQALFLMNSDWVAKLCDRLAAELLDDKNANDKTRINRLYRKAYGREATAQETSRALALVVEVESALAERENDVTRRRLRAWSSLCQVVVSANEFVYVN